MDDTVAPTVATHNSSADGPHHRQPHPGHPDTHDDEQHDLVGLLLDAMRALGLHRPDPALPEAPVSVSEGLALAELAHRAPLSQQQLAERLQLEKSSVSRLTANLQDRGLISRQRDPANRRWSQLTLTDRGRAVAEQLIGRFHQRHQRLFSALTAAERAALATGLSALVRAAQQKPPPDTARDHHGHAQHPGQGA
jgi:DNA-binding MarR family transcriptional regulator